MKKYFLVLFFFSLMQGQVKAQDVLWFTFSATGAYLQSSNQLHDFSIGEMVLVNTFDAGPYLLSQGFLQPDDVTHVLAASEVRVANNVITPNGDGKNDYLVIEGLWKYPGSKLYIYDGAGRKIFTAIDYQNEWNALINGLPLNEDTYYYVIDLGKNQAPLRGFISVVLDYPNQQTKYK